MFRAWSVYIPFLKVSISLVSLGMVGLCPLDGGFRQFSRRFFCGDGPFEFEFPLLREAFLCGDDPFGSPGRLVG